MATTARNASHGKEKTKSSSSAALNGKKGLKSVLPTPTTSNSLSIVTDKPSPHYLKPTISSNKDICYYPKKASDEDSSIKYSKKESEDTTPKYIHNRRKSIDKPQSPSNLKRYLSSSPQGSRFLALPPSSPKSSPKSSPRPISIPDKTPKSPKTPTSRNAKTPAVKKPSNLRKSVSPPGRPKKETKPTIRKKSISCPATPLPKETSETVVVKTVDEKKTASSVQEVEDDPIEIVVDETVQVKTSSIPDHVIDSELKNIDSCDSSILSEEHDLINKSLIESSEERIKEVADVETKPEEQSYNNEDNSESQHEESNTQDEPQVEKEEELEEDDTRDKEVIREKMASGEDAGEEDTPHKLKFQQVKHLDEKEAEDEGSQRLKFKERNEDFEIDEQEESESVVLRRQEVQGKKESPMYNDVIEETASKLVGKRKSKVKALVGAFETVINLENETPAGEEE